MDDRYGNRDNRWRGQEDGNRYRERGSGRDRDRDHGREHGGGGQDGRGFMERAGEEVRSWWGGDDNSDRRHERGQSDRRDTHSADASVGYGATSGGWGNQAGDSWNRERPGSPGAYGAEDGRDYRSSRDSNAMQRDHMSGSGGRGGSRESSRNYGEPTGGGGSGTYGAQRQGGGQHGGAAMGGGGQGRQYDPHYHEWRGRQIESIDRDYDEYRREHQSKFEQDFGNWRTKRSEQRQHMGRVTEHMEVFGSDGEKIGTVDAVHGDRIMLTKNDENAGGHHHSIPCSWIETVDEKVTVNKSREEAMRAWRDEEQSRALFEREDSGSPGPHVLNRSFSGTY